MSDQQDIRWTTSKSSRPGSEAAANDTSKELEEDFNSFMKVARKFKEGGSRQCRRHSTHIGSGIANSQPNDAAAAAASSAATTAAVASTKEEIHTSAKKAVDTTEDFKEFKRKIVEGNREVGTAAPLTNAALREEILRETLTLRAKLRGSADDDETQGESRKVEAQPKVNRRGSLTSFFQNNFLLETAEGTKQESSMPSLTSNSKSVFTSLEEFYSSFASSISSSMADEINAEKPSPKSPPHRRNSIQGRRKSTESTGSGHYLLSRRRSSLFAHDGLVEEESSSWPSDETETANDSAKRHNTDIDMNEITAKSNNRQSSGANDFLASLGLDEEINTDMNTHAATLTTERRTSDEHKDSGDHHTSHSSLSDIKLNPHGSRAA